MNKKFWTIVCASVVLAAGCSAGGDMAMAGPVIDAPAGAVEGKAEGDINVFKGIPFAEPPVGEMRWKPPAELPAWEGTKQAYDFGPACMQPRTKNGTSVYADDIGEVSEDCLTLNVWAPADAEKAPVFVWIHGGALRAGSSSEALYDGTKFADEGIVVVTINYRLGIFGFLAHPELSAESPEGVSGNYAVLDQIAALKWVEENISAFGGDPSNVTVAGESAGALSVLYLMASPKAEGLFDKAVAQSAYMVTTPALKEAQHGVPPNEKTGELVAAALGADGIDALREMDAEEILAGSAKANYAPWGSIDGVVLPRQLVDVFDRGEQADVPVLIGFNSGEVRSMRGLAPAVPEDAAAYEKVIRERYGDLADAFLKLYPAETLEDSIVATTRDALYGWTSERVAVKQKGIDQPTYLYLFDHGYPAADEKGLHGFHASELPYLFGTMDRTPRNWPKIPDSREEQRISDAMASYWASFARSGQPVAEGEPDWLPYGEDQSYMAFGDVPRVSTDVLPGMYELHEEAVCRRRAAGNLPWNWNAGLWSPVLPAKSADCP